MACCEYDNHKPNPRTILGSLSHYGLGFGNAHCVEKQATATKQPIYKHIYKVIYSLFSFKKQGEGGG